MTGYTKAVKTNAPRFVVEYHPTEGGQERFKWGLSGDIPLLSLLGAITTLQRRLGEEEFGESNYCAENVVALVWDGEKRIIPYLNPDIPTIPLIGILEVAKLQLIGSAAPGPMPPKSNIIGPNGLPLPR